MEKKEAETKSGPQLDAQKVLHLTGSTGIFCRTLKGFEPRKSQQIMMSHVIEAYNDNGIALIEAGTGTGKSLAYLLPAIIWALEHKQRTVVSTHTIALQEQLIQKDIPQIINALNVDIKAVLVKGMSNNLCLRKFQEASDEQLLMSPEEREDFARIEAWAATTTEGSRTSLPMMPSIHTWDRIGAESDNCTHVKCPHYQRCFFFKARNQAEEAQILVVNHHLLFADLSVRAETDNYKGQAILPAYSRIIIDEAHHIEDIATDFFGDQISKLSILRLLGRIASEKQNKAQGRLTSLKEKLHAFFPDASASSVRDLFLRMNLEMVGLRNEVQQCTAETFQILSDFLERQSSNPANGEESSLGESKMRLLPYLHQDPLWQTHIISSAQRLITSLEKYSRSLSGLEIELQSLNHDTFQEQSKGIRQELVSFAKRLDEQGSLIQKLIITSPEREKVRWIELFRSKLLSNVSVRDADLDVSKAMVDFLFSKFSTLVLCSATLTTNRQFDFIRNRLGIIAKRLSGKKIIESILDSPFNYAKQALLVIPTDLPMPQEAQFIQKATQQIWQAIESSRGAVFVLFTSYTMMQSCHDLIADRLKEHRYSLFKQGDAERQSLLSQFKAAPRAVLFGTDSFWEGIDVAGEALRCVIIVKLPFKVPTEPIIQARTEAILEQGRDPFTEYTLPAAIVKFKQGFGRLIRHVKDRGCIVCLDTRLINKKYGQQFINSLPNCQQSFLPADKLGSRMRDFYRETHYLTKGRT
ncbi:MAG: DEAD/DEAH box helicase family protein [Parachlamydiaceae bacterium]|nr:DEAD/DEAH box helicase family protein [Parachlamydiaceae bacterium]